jgi:hypothetical protein
MVLCGTGMFMAVTFLLLAVLEPAMWQQWISMESANSNFHYSITLLLGAWQVFLLVQLLLLTVRVERIQAGKEQFVDAPSGTHDNTCPPSASVAAAVEPPPST